VATLVARAAAPEEVFAAVAAEAGRLLDADFAVMSRYDEQGTATVVGAWGASVGPEPLPPGTRLEHGDRSVHALVFATDRPARVENYGESPGVGAHIAKQWGVRVTVGVPIHIESRLWGIIGVASRRDESLPLDTETWLSGFTELVAAAIANAEAQAALTASRARIVAAADTARHRIERDLHDGAQQRLVSLALQLRAAQAAVPPDAGELAAELERAAKGLAAALAELLEIAHGIHPVALARRGLVPALKGLARRSTVPVRLDIRIDARLPEHVELGAYYVVAEALTNVAKHADANRVDVEVVADAGVVRVCVRDDGRGGADFSRGTGLVGLKDRVETLGGCISLHSPPGAGTSVEIALPNAG
jgi:signal transduction histidine kinase